MDGIFISYRRDDSAGYAGRLYDRLAAHFGSDRVFMDVEGIEPGVDFVSAIEDAVASCRVLIVMIGDEWTHAIDAAGRRRLDDPGDFIRIETATALQRGIRVVPVLVGGAVMPLADELPPDLKPLTRRQAIEINHKQWEASSGELIRTLERILASATTPVAPASVPSSQVSPPQVDPARVSATPVKAPDAVVPAGAAAPAGTGPKRWLAISGLALVLAGIVAWFGLTRQPVQQEPVPQAGAGGAGRPAIVPATPPAQMQPTAPTVAPVPEVASSAARPLASRASVPATPAEVPPEQGAASGQKLATAAPADRQASTLATERTPASAPESSTSSPPLPAQSRKPAPAPAATRQSASQQSEGQAARPAPRVTPAPARQPVAKAEDTVAAPAAAASPDRGAGVADAGRPLAGEHWTYQSRGKWPTSPKRRFEVAIQSVANGVVTDALRLVEPDTAAGGEVRRSAGRRPGFVDWAVIGTEFSPYWGAFVELSRGEGARGFETPDVGGYWTNWHSVARVLGEESVSVPAGTFSAYKVEVWSTRNATGGPAQAQLEPVGIHYLVWYAPEAKRYVKMQRRIISASNSENERDVFELVAHRMP